MVKISCILIFTYFMCLSNDRTAALPYCDKPRNNYRRQMRKCVPIRKWEKYVPYKLSECLPQDLRTMIKDVINKWNNMFKNCIEFRERKVEADYVTFVAGDGCYSAIGKFSGNRNITLDPHKCGNPGQIIHEMMHTIGFLHEHTRPDRDKYIKVNFNNIPPKWHKEYQRRTDFYFGELGPYDYYSVMHYRIFYPDCHGPVFEILKRGINEYKVGAQTHLTELDEKKVRKLYCQDE